MAVAQQTNAPTDDRRRAARRQPTLGTVCRLASEQGESFCVGLVWNLSASGVSMLLHKPMEPGTTMRAELMTENQSVSLPLSLRVAHVSKLRTGDYVIGGQFPRQLNPEEMRPFLG